MKAISLKAYYIRIGNTFDLKWEGLNLCCIIHISTFTLELGYWPTNGNCESLKTYDTRNKWNYIVWKSISIYSTMKQIPMKIDEDGSSLSKKGLTSTQEFNVVRCWVCKIFIGFRFGLGILFKNCRCTRTELTNYYSRK